MKRVIAILLSAFMAAALCSCSPTNTETMSNAQKALEEGDFENAAALYQAAIDEGKQLQACYRGKGIALMGRMEYENAVEAFNKALESATFIEEKIYRDGMEDDIRRYLASCYIHNGEPQQAILVYNALIEKNDSVISLYTERGTAVRRKEYRRRLSCWSRLCGRARSRSQGKDPLLYEGLSGSAGPSRTVCGGR